MTGPDRPPGPPVAEVAAVLAGVRPEVELSGLHRLSGGASRETWACTATTPTGTEELIVRRDPPGRPGPPGAMALEAAAMRAAAAGLPVPDVLVDDDGTHLGTAGLVMGRIEGETIPRRILRDDRYATARRALAGQCGRFLAGLHAIDPAGVPGLAAADPLAVYREAYDALDDVSPTFERAFRWLDATRPPSYGEVVVHGDFRLGNLLVDDRGLRAVLDWELVHLGDPLEDLAWLCVKAWRFRSPLPVGGFGTVEALTDTYREAGGPAVDPDDLRWWLVVNTLKWGVMCLGQADAHLTGTHRSVELAAIGRRACEQEWDLLELLAPEATAVARTIADEPVPPGPGLHGRTTAVELLAAAGAFLRDDAVGATDGVVQFHARVTANVVAMVERELLLGPVQEERHRRGLDRLGATSEADLARAIATGHHDGDPGALDDVLAATVHDKVAVANPGHLTT